MRKQILPIIVFLLLATNVYSFSIVRSVPSEVAPGEEFTVTYTIDGEGEPIWGTSIKDDLTGGCIRLGADTRIRLFATSNSDSVKTAIIKAQSTSGTCTFTGDYQVSFNGVDQGITEFPTATVNVVSECVPDTCAQRGYSCGTFSSCGQTVSCGSCGANQNCVSFQCQTAAECTTSSECDLNEYCINGACIQLIEEETCQFWEEDVNGECEINKTFLIIAAIIIIILFLGRRVL